MKEAIERLQVIANQLNESGQTKSANDIREVMLEITLKQPWNKRQITVEQVVSELKCIEISFGIGVGAMRKRHTSGRPLKSYRGICLSTLRKAFVWHIFSLGEIKLINFGTAMELDHSSISVMKSGAADYIETGYDKFLNYLQRIKSASGLVCEAL